MNARADLYHFLAEALADPPAWLGWAGPEWPLYASASQLAHHSPAAGRSVALLGKKPSEPVEAIKKRYQAMISGQGSKPLIWLYASLHGSGRLAGPATFAVERTYREAGLALQSSELPDHASIELAFLSFLASAEHKPNRPPNRPGPKERQFLKQHAGNWLVSLGQQLMATQDPVYGTIGALLANWLSENCATQNLLQKTAFRPGLEDAEKCILCGFCAQVCPTGALVVRENEYETSLAFLPAACTGCAKCVRTCESDALAIDAGQPQSENDRRWHKLLSSPRAVCALCGTPTVSQAEMQYMESVLGQTGWLRSCFDCRSGVRERTV